MLRSRRSEIQIHISMARIVARRSRRRRQAIKSKPVLRDDLRIPPYGRFRRIAKAIALMLKVCKICKRIVYDSVSSQDWFTMIDKFVEGEEKFFEANPGRRPRPFVTFLPDEERGELIQLSFDKSEFSRENRSDHLLTNDVRHVLETDPNHRTVTQQNELVRFLKRLSTDFNGYPMEMQRRLAKCLYYDRYYPSRILTREGLMADRVYFVLSGTLAEKAEGNKRPQELKSGDRFGEEDIICACPRRSTVVTKTTVEILSVHRIDYRAIFNMADDSNNPRYLEICRKDLVFQHFPLKKLIENSGTWAILSYKFGRLMVKDSNDTEWIYIIKSGEARVIKHLETTYLDVEARKKKQLERNSHSRDAKNRILLDFMSENKNMASHYRSGRYTPAVAQRSLKSAPVSRATSTLQMLTKRSQSQHSFVTVPPIGSTVIDQPSATDSFATNLFRVRPKSQPSGCQEREPATTEPKPPLQRSNTQQSLNSQRRDPRNGEALCVPGGIHSLTKAISTRRVMDGSDAAAGINTETISNASGSHTGQNKWLRTPSDHHVKLPEVIPPTQDKSRQKKEASSAKVMRPVPPFVQLECLRSGQVFGMRSCLEPEERGPSVSLVSAGCEVLQISKKFFMKHADESVLGLIRVKCKPFPSEDDMLDRLDDSLDWQDYKEATMRAFFKERGRPSHAQQNHPQMA